MANQSFNKTSSSISLSRTPPGSRFPSPPAKLGPVATRPAPFSAQAIRRTQATISIFSMPGLQQEPEDARLTGGTRSLQRRLLALNLGYIPRVRIPPISEAKVA